MSSASALLFYEEPKRKAVTGKIYEYLATGLPILCATSPDNLGASLVRDSAPACASMSAIPRRPLGRSQSSRTRGWADGFGSDPP